MWIGTPCPACGEPWWLGADEEMSSVPVLDPLSPSGLTVEGEQWMAEMRAWLGVCSDCRDA